MLKKRYPRAPAKRHKRNAQRQYAHCFDERRVFMNWAFLRKKSVSEALISIAEKKGKEKKKKVGAMLIAALAVIFAAAVCGCGAGKEDEYHRSTAPTPVMGTMASLVLYTDSGAGDNLKRMEKELFRDARAAETELLSLRLDTAEVYRINKALEQGKQEIAISEELQMLLSNCLDVSESCEGAFDISLGALTGLWKIDEKAAGTLDGEVPAKAEILAAKSLTGYERVALKGNLLTAPKGYVIDLGAVGKGYALDRAFRILEKDKLIYGKRLYGTFSIGGSVLTYGEKPDGVPWKVAIINPFDSRETIGYLELNGTNYISTSGDYERFFEANGIRYHHILDPNTGYPAQGEVNSVTILADRGYLSDALSTAVFLLGKEEGMKLCELYQAGVLLVEKDGTITCNERMQQVFHRNEN